MKKLEKKLYGLIGINKLEENGKITIDVFYDDMFEWATSWCLVVATDFEKPIKAYKHFFKYCTDNGVDFYDEFNSVQYPDENTQEKIEKYFYENRVIYNKLLDKLKLYNKYTEENFENEKFIS